MAESICEEPKDRLKTYKLIKMVKVRSNHLLRPVITGDDPNSSIKVRIAAIRKPPLPSFHENPNVCG
jgi:hypothetical protein